MSKLKSFSGNIIWFCTGSPEFVFPQRFRKDTLTMVMLLLPSSCASQTRYSTFFINFIYQAISTLCRTALNGEDWHYISTTAESGQAAPATIISSKTMLENAKQPLSNITLACKRLSKVDSCSQWDLKESFPGLKLPNLEIGFARLSKSTESNKCCYTIRPHSHLEMFFSRCFSHDFLSLRTWSVSADSNDIFLHSSLPEYNIIQLNQIALQWTNLPYSQSLAQFLCMKFSQITPSLGVPYLPMEHSFTCNNRGLDIHRSSKPCC